MLARGFSDFFTKNGRFMLCGPAGTSKYISMGW